MTHLPSVDPRRKTTTESSAEETSMDRVAAMGEEAAIASARLEAIDLAARAQLLRAIAESLDADRDAVVTTADRETALGRPRLDGELTRAVMQFRFFADVVEEASFLEATIDHPVESPTGRRPDLRRYLTPIGPVAVFGASNFPLAFCVPGGHTASALAAGCAVVVKPHPSHPDTAERCLAAIGEAVKSSGLPAATVSAVHGMEAGVALVGHHAIRAVAFTGSRRGANGLLDVIHHRGDEVPFYGELGSLNAVVVTRAAAAERAATIAAGFVESFTQSMGQFCTKPGVLFLPDGDDGRALLDDVVAAVGELPSGVLLNQSIQRDFLDRAAHLAGQPGVDVLATGKEAAGDGCVAAVALLGTDALTFASPGAEVLRDEVFGPCAIVVTYRNDDDLVLAVGAMDGSLATAVHIGAGDDPAADPIQSALRGRSGRIVYNGFPTGVAVSWAMHHGGPFPATTSALHTSVGASSMRRFLQPVCFQDAPDHLLPGPLRDVNPWPVPRRIDGRLVPASAAATPNPEER